MSRNGAAGCELRPAGMADLDAVALIWHASASLPGVGPAAMPDPASMRDEIGARFASGEWRMTLAVRAGEIAGFAALHPAEARLAELFVRPASIGNGFGRALLDHAKAAMPAGFTLYTRPANLAARRFYEREGLAFLRDGAHPRTGEPVVFYGWSPPAAG